MSELLEQRREAMANARAAAAVHRARRAAEKEAKLAAAPVREDEPVAIEEEDDVLSQLIATLGKARNKKANQTKLLHDLGTLMDQIDPKEHPELAEDPTIMAFVEKVTGVRIAQALKAGAQPGTVVGSGLAQQDIPWKESDLARYALKADGSPDLHTFTPNETIPIFWNGIRCQLIADEELTTYKCFYDVYMEHKRLSRVGDQHKAYMFGQSDRLPPELTTGDAAVATAQVRAFMHMGPRAGGGTIINNMGAQGMDQREGVETPQT